MEETNNNSRSNFPLLGDKFPSMEVKTTQGQMALPDDMEGNWFVLFSHPADFTPVCTSEFYSFASKNDKFEELGCKLVGLSIDQVFSHIKWLQWIEDNLDLEVPFPVIADDMGEVSKRLGMVHPGKGTNTVRAVFVVDDKGIVRTILYYPQEIGRNMEEILRVVRALKTSDKKKVALPANWPKNELIKDKGIIPPAADKKTADERSGAEDCYDWWFCYKDLD
jgi:peroxiredoxin (alkyl hydroperoxide reductase subunit C)